MCSSPVTLGGGIAIVKCGLELAASARNRSAFSQREYQPASMACGSKAEGMGLLMGMVELAVPRDFYPHSPSNAGLRRRGIGSFALECRLSGAVASGRSALVALLLAGFRAQPGSAGGSGDRDRKLRPGAAYRGSESGAEGRDHDLRAVLPDRREDGLGDARG